MRLTEEDVEFEWSIWGASKPWWCPHCKTFLASDFYEECNGTDPEVPTTDWKPHKAIKAQPPVTKEQFTKYLLQQYGQASLEIEDVDEEDETT